MKLIYNIIFISILVSCAHQQPLSKSGKKVLIIKSPTNQCKFITDISYWSFMGAKDITFLHNTFKNKVAEANGNAGVIDMIYVGNSNITGKAYRCPSQYIKALRRSIYKKQ